MSFTQRLDAFVERGAGALEAWARDLAVDGGFRRQIAEELLDDAAFLRKLAPTKMAARARGDMPATGVPAEPAVAVLDEPVVTPAAGPAEPSMPAAAPPKPRPPKKGGGGPNPLVVVGMAFVAGVALAKLIDWRGHAFPRR
jgi:hypothetical protein